MTEYPATYEIDAAGEATGHVLPFCSLECQQRHDPPFDRAVSETTGGEDCGAPDFSCCECGTFITPS